MPCAPWHIVQFSASVAPRPTASLAAGARHRSLEHDVGRRAGRACGRRRRRCASRRHARRAADARPEALGGEVAVHRRQPHEADQHDATVSDDERRRRSSGTTGCPRRRRRRLVHHRLPIGMTGTDASFSERELRDRVAVVDDREARSSSPPTGRSRSAPTGVVAPGCAARLKVKADGAVVGTAVRAREDADEKSTPDSTSSSAADGRRDHGPGLRLRCAGLV